jgi:molybdate transport system regulatory protein
MDHRLKLKLQLYCGEEIAFGPGKAALLEAIGETGSISAAARNMGMSYRRAWQLVDAMNRCFRRPLVETVTGSGAQVTHEGEAVLAAYRAMCKAAEKGAGDAGLAVLAGSLRSTPKATERP